MIFESEKEFEKYLRRLIENKITSIDKTIYALANKKAVDIVIIRDSEEPGLFFLEVKYHVNSNGRLGFGSGAGEGFQPEILTKRPKYFETNLRWVISSEDHETIWFVDNETILHYASGGNVGQKFNNIQKKIFKEQKGLTENEFLDELQKWLTR